MLGRLRLLDRRHRLHLGRASASSIAWAASGVTLASGTETSSIGFVVRFLSHSSMAPMMETESGGRLTACCAIQPYFSGTNGINGVRSIDPMLVRTRPS